jgi:DNA-binding transcriptional MerR regulator
VRDLQSYTIDELEEATGVSRRNIRLYISMGLLPGVGRRGPRTRYGQEYVDRLNFIQRVKQLQDAGQVPHSTLDYLGGTFKHILTAEEVAEGSRSNARMIELFERMRVERAARRTHKRAASVDDDPPMMAAREEPYMSEADSVPGLADIEVDRSSSDEPEQWWSSSEATFSGGADEPDTSWEAPAAPADGSVVSRGLPGLDALHDELSVTRIRAQTEIKKLNELTEEVSELSSRLQREKKSLKEKIKRILGKSDDGA